MADKTVARMTTSQARMYLADPKVGEAFKSRIRRVKGL